MLVVVARWDFASIAMMCVDDDGCETLQEKWVKLKIKVY